MESSILPVLIFFFYSRSIWQIFNEMVENQDLYWIKDGFEHS